MLLTLRLQMTMPDFGVKGRWLFVEADNGKSYGTGGSWKQSGEWGEFGALSASKFWPKAALVAADEWAANEKLPTPTLRETEFAQPAIQRDGHSSDHSTGSRGRTVKLGLVSNERLPRGVHWTLLLDPLYAEIEKLVDTIRIAAPPISASTAIELWRINRSSQGLDALLSMHGKARPELPLQIATRPMSGALRAVFYVDPWAHSIEKIRLADRILGHDLVFIPYLEAHRALTARESATRYVYLPFACDSSVFRDTGAVRDIDILWMGRRTDPLHQAILRFAEERNLNYQYREKTGFISDPRDLGNLASRARYFVVTPPSPQRSGGYSPLLMRYFEGLAAGCRLLGTRPRSGEFERILPVRSILEVDENGKDIQEKFDADAFDETAWQETEKARAMVHARHGWDSRAKTIVASIAEAAMRA